MGGIAGIVYPNAFQVSDILASMLKTMTRSPDEIRDVHVFRNLQISSAGQNVFINSKKTIAIALDGNLRDVKSLAATLKKEGFPVNDKNDAELILHAYECWGKNFLKHISGNFALAIIDKTKKSLLLACDRIGKKNLYWSLSDRRLVFASELKSLLASGMIPPTPAKEALSAYLFFGYMPQDMTPIQGINKLLPGHVLEFGENASSFLEPYWYFLKPKPSSVSLEHSSSAFGELLKASVQSLIPEDRPVGALLSGGLGSATIAFHLKQALKEGGLQAFSVDFEGETSEDLKAAKEIADTLKIEHHIKTITPENFLDNLVPIFWFLDAPLADPNVIATWHLGALASPVTKTVFSGMGSDELLAGHTRYIPKISPVKGGQFSAASFWMRSFLLPVISKISKTASYYLLRRSQGHFWQLDYLNQNALFTENLQKKAAPELAGQFNPKVFLDRFYFHQETGPSVSSFLLFDIKTRLVDCFIQQYQLLLSSQNLQWETPFLSLPILEYIASLPILENLKEEDTALFLKKLMRDHFSEDFLYRPKVARPYLLKSWVKKSALKEIFPMLCSGKLAESGLISSAWLKDATASVEKQTENFRFLWGILSLEIWFRLFVHRSIGSCPPQISIQELLSEP